LQAIIRYADDALFATRVVATSGIDRELDSFGLSRLEYQSIRATAFVAEV